MPIPFTIPSHLQSYVRRVQSGTLSLHCYDAGSSDIPMLLIHGLGDEADTWQHVIPALAQKQRVIALDLPGFGRSDQPRLAYTLVFYARAVLGLLDSLGIGSAKLVGSSMGAAVAQRLALARPERVASLTLVDGSLPITSGPPPIALLPFLMPGVGELAYTSLRKSQDQAYATLRPYYADLDALSDAQRAFLRERVWARVWSDGQRRAFLSSLRWMSIERALRGSEYVRRLSQLATPTQLIWGAQDLVQPAHLADAMAAVLPNARITIIEHCGHLPQQERPDQFVSNLE